MKDYKVWDCKIVIAGDSNTPMGFDAPPRRAAQKAIEDAGFEVLSNASGWGGTIDKYQRIELDGDDGMENVEVEFEDEDFIALAKMAHEKDITFNMLITEMLTSYIDEQEAKKE